MQSMKYNVTDETENRQTNQDGVVSVTGDYQQSGKADSRMSQKFVKGVAAILLLSAAIAVFAAIFTLHFQFQGTWYREYGNLEEKIQRLMEKNSQDFAGVDIAIRKLNDTMLQLTDANEENTACNVTWGSWTECTTNDVRYRNRQCQNGLETGQGYCSFDAACTVSWGNWAECSMQNVRYRNRLCPTGLKIEQGNCTKVGFTSDGWYRHTNGYEYRYLSTKTSYTAATSSCSSMDSTARLATVAARNGDLSSFDKSAMKIPDGTVYYVGASDAIIENSWIFQDSVVIDTNDIAAWVSGEPNMGLREGCMVWLQTKGGRVGLGDAPCAGSYSAMCERLIV